MNGAPFIFNDFYYLFLIMFYTYYLRSLSHQHKTYVGFTSNLKQRLDEHNAGKAIYTQAFRPWELICFFGFKEAQLARNFEKYLKSNAGKKFLHYHVIAQSEQH